MGNSAKKLKLKISAISELLPFGKDLYILLLQAHQRMSYRGVFNNFEQTKNAVKSNKKSSYDIINTKKATNIESEKLSLTAWFHDVDYPLLFWLSQILPQGPTVLELGGSIGHFFYSLERFYQYPINTKWLIAELPEAVKLGRTISTERNESRLLFIESSEVKSCEPVDIFLTAGTLQYMEVILPDILQRLEEQPKHVLIHNLPVHNNKHFWTLQDLGVCEVPYQIYSDKNLKAEMKQLGFELVASWVNPRKLEIPFHRKLEISGYLGYYFRKINV